MSTLMLVNPRSRKRRSKSGRKNRSAAQRRATAKLVAMNRARNPAKRRRRRNPVAALANPARRVYRRTRRKSNPMRSYKRRRRNPISLPSMGGIVSMLKQGAIGAGGALAVDLAMSNLPIPATFVTRTNADGSPNYLYYGSKIAIASLLGTLGRKFLGQKAVTMAEGAFVVNMYDLFRTLMPSNVRLGYFTPAPIARNMGAYIPGRKMGAYVPNGSTATATNPAMRTQLGGFNPAIVSTRSRQFSRV